MRTLIVIIIMLLFSITICQSVINTPTIINTTGGTFDLDVNIIITPDTSAARKYVSQFYSNAVTEDFDARSTTFESVDGTAVVMWFADTLNKPIIAHECAHATYSILAWAGIPLSSTTEEVYAYEEQWLFNKVLTP